MILDTCRTDEYNVCTTGWCLLLTNIELIHQQDEYKVIWNNQLDLFLRLFGMEDVSSHVLKISGVII